MNKSLKFVNENKQVLLDFFTRAEMNRQIAGLERNTMIIFLLK